MLQKCLTTTKYNIFCDWDNSDGFKINKQGAVAIKPVNILI